VTEPQAAAPGRDELLATKLRVPGPRPGLVARPRLSARLSEGEPPRLVLVCAPAGYGKTVLLADWTQRRSHPAAWLSLDPGDNDPARFWRHTVAALDRALPGLSARVGPLLGPPAPASWEPAVTALVNDLAADHGPGELTLILDDYHLISAAAVHESVSFLLAHQPPGLALVLASRADPPLALARLRARGQLAEVRVADLRFTADEAAELLAGLAGPDGPAPALPAGSVAALAARTEGWAAGLQLAGLSLRGQPDAQAFVAAFTGSHRYVLDYLAEEVLERQDAPVREFLLETSVLDRLSGPLCDAVTGRDGSQDLLEQVERAGLFLIPLDEVRGWWRYHHLFADLLRARLDAQPGRAAGLHDRAAAWYEAHGMPGDAIGHAVAAGQPDRAARIIERHFDATFYLHGETATIQRWLAALPAGLVRARPRLLLARAQLAAAAGQPEAIERAADAAERAAATVLASTGPDEPFEPTVGAAASLIANISAHIALDRSYAAQLRGDANATARHASEALQLLGPGDETPAAIAHGLLGVAEWLAGRLDEAEDAFRYSLDDGPAARQPTVAAWSAYQLARVQQAQGELGEAARTALRALDAAARIPGRDGPLPPVAGPACVALAAVAYQRDQREEAGQRASQGVELCRRFVYTAPLAAGLATLAWLRQADGDPAGARALMDEAVAAAPGPAGLLSPAAAERARLLVAQGDLAGAERWAREAGLAASDVTSYPHEPCYLVLARILLAREQHGPALELLSRLDADAGAVSRVGSLIEIGALRALAFAAAGDQEEAVTRLAGAMSLAYQDSQVRVFADEGAPMAALVARLVAARRDPKRRGQPVGGIPLAYLALLRRALGLPAPAAGTPGGGLPDPLTARELEVLTLLAAGATNPRIARTLVVTLDTVKKHVSHVLAKLGAGNRTEAVARARELGLLR
jgi:LuxR family maltose regulon positive regulatory protein